MKYKFLTAGCTQSLIDEYVFFKGSVILILYVDDGIFLSPTDSDLTKSVNDLQCMEQNIEDLGHSSDDV
ncbi:hypothetical protein ACHAXS_008632 [Conticribra weissflogii]